VLSLLLLHSHEANATQKHGAKKKDVGGMHDFLGVSPALLSRAKSAILRYDMPVVT
jgi:hypothetical protein